MCLSSVYGRPSTPDFDVRTTHHILRIKCTLCNIRHLAECHWGFASRYFVSTTMYKLLCFSALWISCPALSSCGCDWRWLLIPLALLYFVHRAAPFLRVWVPLHSGTILLLFKSSGASLHLCPFPLLGWVSFSAGRVCREPALISRTFRGGFLAFSGSLEGFFHVQDLGDFALDVSAPAVCSWRLSSPTSRHMLLLLVRLP